MSVHFLQRRLLLPVTTSNNGKTAINKKLHNKNPNFKRIQGNSQIISNSNQSYENKTTIMK